MIGYKATDMNGCCRGFKFEVGKTYTKDTKKEDLKSEIIRLCNADKLDELRELIEGEMK